MNENLAIFLVLLSAMIAAVILVLGTTRIRARSKLADLQGRADGDARRAGQLAVENAALRDQVERQEERLQVLERIATDPAERTAREIEQLR